MNAKVGPDEILDAMAPEQSAPPKPEVNWFGFSGEDILTRWCAEGLMLSWGSEPAFQVVHDCLKDAMAANNVARVKEWERVYRWMCDFKDGIMQNSGKTH